MTSQRDLPKERLVSVLQQVPAFVAVLRGPDHVFEVANPAYRKLIHHRDPIGQPVRDVLPEIESQGFIDLLDGVYRTGETYVGTEQSVVLRSTAEAAPEERILNFVYQADRNGDGGIVGVIVHGVDVTEQVRARQTAERQAEQLQRQAVELEETRAELEAANGRLATAMKEAEESRARLEAVIEQMPSGVMITNAADGTVVLGNRQVEEIWKQPSPRPGEHWRGRFVAFHHDGTPYTSGQWPLERALQGEATLNEEMAILRADGTRGTISVSSGPIRDRDGNVVAAVAVFDDVTERSQHETEQAFLVEAARILASSLDYQETLASVARLSVPRMADWCAVDVLEDGVLQSLAVVHVEPEKERLAWEVARRWPPPTDAAHGVPRVLRTGEPEAYAEVSEDHLRRWARNEEHLEALKSLGIRSRMVLPMVARGRTLGAITFVSTASGRRYGPGDLRAAEKLASRAAMAIDNALLFRQAERSRDEAELAQRRAEEARRLAEAANRAKSEFLANMSHEMRTPLNAVTGYTELLEMEIAGSLNPEQKAQLARIRDSTAHLLSLINDLLDLARIEAGRMEVQRHQENAAETVAGALALLGRQAAEREIDLSQSCANDGETRYVGDRDRARQILVNLIGNALKFTNRGGRVRVACGVAERADAQNLAAEAGPWVYVRVEDTGVGIAAEQMERIFHPFEQVHGGYTRESGGAGLGLSISRQLALLMGGDLTARSTPGVGSVFTLWLPADGAGELQPELELPAVREGAGLARVSEALLAEIDGILGRYVHRLRADPLIAHAGSLAEADLKDHHSSLISDFAATLVALAEPGESRTRLLRDGSEIQRVVSDLHGRQRAGLGWTEAALRREFDVWREELSEALARSDALRSQPELLQDGVRVLEQMIERSRRISLRSFRAAAMRQQGSIS